MDNIAIRHSIMKLLESQRLAALSTHDDRGHPYVNLIAFQHLPDLSALFFATSRSTRKYANLNADPRVAFLIDSRSNREEDFHQASAVTALGEAKEVELEEIAECSTLFLAKHPFLVDFLQAPTTGLYRVRISTYIHVSRFQEVFELNLDHA